jgi:RHS repeat-associated protein
MKSPVFHLDTFSKRKHLLSACSFAIVVVSLAMLLAGRSQRILATLIGPQHVVTAIIPQNVLLVTNAPPPLKAGDLAIQNRLGTLGYTVSVITGSMVLSSDASGKALVVISSTVKSGDVNTKFRNAIVPVLTWEKELFYPMGMTGSIDGTDSGSLNAQTKLVIANPSHYMAAGLSGTVTVITTQSDLNWGKPNANALKIATLLNNPAKAAIFAYEKGVAMPGLSAPARRVGMYMTDQTAGNFNNNGWALFDAAVRWAANTAPTVSLTSPEGGSTFVAPASITVSADVNDNGSVDKVEFYAGTTLIGNDSTSPYSIIWSNVLAGSYALTAKATDNLGESATSAGVNITVANPIPAISLANPNTGQQGQSLAVVITGQNTHFLQGTSQVSFGAGISVTTVTVTNATSLTANISIAPSAATGVRTVSVTTGAEVVNLTSGFTVNAGTPVLLSATPGTGQQGQTLDVTVSGQFTHFVQGTTVVSFGAAIVVNSMTVATATSLSANISIDAAASVGARTVTVTTGTEVVNLTSGFAVNAGTPVLTSVTPTSGQQGQTLDVAVAGQFTHFVQGTTVVSFGTAVTVNSVTVGTATSLSANVSIGAAAANGARTVNATTGTEVVQLIDSFTVTAASPAAISSVSPNSGQQGQTNLSLNITGQNTSFLQGTTTVDLGANITVNSVTVATPTSLAANISVGASAAIGARTVTVTTVTQVATLNNGFTVTAGPTGPPLPPDPVTVAPPLDRSVATTLAAATEFLYTGNNPIQTGVAPGTIDPIRATVLRGKVSNRDGSRLTGVKITILNHPEFGSTLSRADGAFDLASNGGGPLVVDYDKAGFIGAQRQIDAPWQDYVQVPEVVMIPYDTEVTPVTLGTSAPMQTARGSVVTDGDGTRRPTVIFPAGTTGSLIMPNGSSSPISNLHVRATEFTVGPSGPAAMPAELPATSAYTHAVELSADEAVAAGAKRIFFNQPVFYYLENFLGFPTGQPIPTGSYDQTSGQWVPRDNGVVLQVLSIVSGQALLDVDGTGSATPEKYTALGITGSERTQLAALYQPGTSLWRVPMIHFSKWDSNMSFAPPPGSTSPNQSDPNNLPLSCPNGPNVSTGSIIECQNQILGETVPLVGTPSSLNYSSDRVPGRKTAYSLNFSLSGPVIPPPLARIDFYIYVAGKVFRQSFPAAANQRVTFTWDGKDAYDRVVQGNQPYTAYISYVYNPMYQRTDRFGYNGNGLITTVPGRTEISLSQRITGSIGAWDAKALGLGAWTLSLHHAYDPIGRVLYLGDGSRTRADGLSSVMKTAAGPTFPGGGSPFLGDGIAVGRAGRVLFSDANNNRILRLSPTGTVDILAGTGVQGFSGDGGPASSAQLKLPSKVAVGPDGSIYVLDTGNLRVRKIGLDGVITTVAGNGTSTYAGDGSIATATGLSPGSLTVAADGTIYIGQPANNNPILRVTTDRIISRVGGGTANAGELAAGPDGSIYFSRNIFHQVYKVAPDGTVAAVAGTGAMGYSGDGGPATLAQLWSPRGITVALDGSLYVADQNNNRIRKVGTDGIISTVAGTGIIGSQIGNGFDGDNGPATAARMTGPVGLTISPDGAIYITDQGNRRVRSVTPALPGFSLADIIIPSGSGDQIYHFNNFGRHLETIDSLTGAIQYQFGYDSNFKLGSITDADGNVTTVEHSGENPSAIVGPYGQRTSLTVDGNGYLASINNPAGESAQLQSTQDGLLTQFTNPNGNTYQFAYGAQGRLLQDDDPAGGSQALSHTEQNNGKTYTVTRTTALGRTTTYKVENLDTGGSKRTNTFPNGLQSVTQIGADSSSRVTNADGTVTTLNLSPDPRFGLMAPIAGSFNITTPSGLTSSSSTSRSVTLSDLNNLLSLTSQTDTFTLNGQTYTSIFDSALRRITETSPVGRNIFTTLDSKGRVAAAQLQGLTPIQFAYDSRGRIATITQGNRVNTLHYDALGNLASLADPLSRTMRFEYDSSGRILKQILPDTREIQFGYDANGNVSSIAPPGRPNHSFTYTPIDFQQDYIPPNVGAGTNSTHYSYNIDRQLTEIQRPDEGTVSFDYDSAGRPSTLRHSLGTVTFGYDAAKGNLKTVTTSAGVAMNYTYDGDLLTNFTYSGPITGSVHRTYDNNFRVASETVNGGNPVAFQYDNDDLLASAGSLNITRNSQNGLVTGTTLGGVTDSYSYNSFGEMAGYAASFNGTPIFSYQLVRDDLGRIVQKTETVSGETHVFGYGYDLSGRLTQVAKDGVLFSQYTYDANGNRLTKTDSSGTIVGTYDNQDRQVQYGNNVYSYTANGELKTKTDTLSGVTTSYIYDALGNLLAATLSDGTQIQYLVDGRNRRIGTKANGALVQAFLYEDAPAPVAELDSSNNLVSRFIYAIQENVPDYMVRNSATYRIISDRLGSPRVVINVASGEIAQHMDYDEFGNVVFDTNPGFQKFGFAGGLYESSTKLVRFGKRDYDAEIGRWTAKDPNLFVGGDVNLYGYVLNDPISWKDPRGLDFVTPEEGQHIAEVAQGWVGVPYKRGGRTKSEADCSGSIWGIYKDAGFPYDYVQTSDFPNSPRFEPAPGNIPQPGDVGLFKGHVVLYAAFGPFDLWSAHEPGKPFSSALLERYEKYFLKKNQSKVQWYRYNKPDPPSSCSGACQ